MGRNIEIKARVRRPAEVRRAAESLADGPVELLHQKDFFFHTAEGRLKLRVFSPDRGELIFYQRDDRDGPKRSEYSIAATTDPNALRRTLSAALGVRGIVLKIRRLYRHGRTRIHLDAVDGLGDFLELEVVLKPNQTDAEGEAEARRLMDLLGVDPEDLVSEAYIDMLGVVRSHP